MFSLWQPQSSRSQAQYRPATNVGCLSRHHFSELASSGRDKGSETAVDPGGFAALGENHIPPMSHQMRCRADLSRTESHGSHCIARRLQPRESPLSLASACLLLLHPRLKLQERVRHRQCRWSQFKYPHRCGACRCIYTPRAKMMHKAPHTKTRATATQRSRMRTCLMWRPQRGSRVAMARH